MKANINFPQREESSTTNTPKQGNVATKVDHMTSSKENHVTPVERRVGNGVKQIILLPNVAVGKTITQGKDVRLFDDDVVKKVFKT